MWLRKAERFSQILELLSLSYELSTSQIASRLGLTRQRVQQLVNQMIRAGYPIYRVGRGPSTSYILGMQAKMECVVGRQAGCPLQRLVGGSAGRSGSVGEPKPR